MRHIGVRMSAPTWLARGVLVASILAGAPAPASAQSVINAGSGTGAVILADGFEDLPPAVFDPDSRFPIPDDAVSADESKTELRLGFSYPRLANASDLRVLFDGTDVTSTCELVAHGTTRQFVTCWPGVAYEVGTHSVTVQIGQSNAAWSYSVVPAPTIIVTPENASVAPGAIPEVVATIEDSASDLVVASIALTMNSADVPGTFDVEMTNPRAGVVRYRPPVDLPPGRYLVDVVVANTAGGTAKGSGSFTIRTPGVNELELLDPPDRSVVHEPDQQLRFRAISTGDQVPRVWVNGTEADLGEEIGLFEVPIRLLPGDNTIEIRARFSDGEERTLSPVLTLEVPLSMSIDTPRDMQVFGRLPAGSGNALNLTGEVARPIDIAGTTNRPVQRVVINQQSATLGPDGKSFRFVNFFLHEGTNHITVTASTATGDETSSSATVFVDQTAPLVHLDAPNADEVTSASHIDVLGTTKDAVEALVQSPVPVVRVRNLSNAAIVDGVVHNERFLARALPLVVGRNTIELTASDVLDNARTQRFDVFRVAVGSRRLAIVSGNHQSAAANAGLMQPLVLSALDVDGSPLVGKQIDFAIVEGSGRLGLAAGPPASGDGLTPARSLSATTNAQGLATVWWTLGQESGPAAQILVASSAGVPEVVRFAATVLEGAPARVVISGASGHQFAETRSEPLEALTALVVDAANNPLGEVRLRFFVQEGDALFDDRSAMGGLPSPNGREITVVSDKNGIVAVRPKLGESPSTVRIMVVAMFGDEVVAGPEFFQISVLEPRSGPTRFSGVVLDHDGHPLPGVQVSISRTTLAATTDTDGRFAFADGVPSGRVDLFIDGRTAPAEQGHQYPALHFETSVIKGQSNQLPHPIYLPAINLSQARIVGGSEDVTLTIPGFEGFEMRVRANSVTFPDGSRVGPLVVTTVHADRLPMVPPGVSGTFGALAWTIQPTGTRFDPPIEVAIPNASGLAPGRKLDIYQWDHDLAMFVPIGLATVNESGTQVISDPGSGISKAGWGGGPPPVPPNCGENPPPACRGGSCGCDPDCATSTPPPGGTCPANPACVPKPLSEGIECEGNACKHCQSGTCSTKFDETEPPKAQTVRTPRPSPEIGALTKGVGYTAYMSSDSEGYNATWRAGLKPYCRPEGKWKYSLAAAELAARVVIDRTNWNDLTDSVITQLAAETPTSKACRLLTNATYSLKVGASSHFTTNNTTFNFALNPDLSGGGQHLQVAGYNATRPWTRQEAIEAHEYVHFGDLQRALAREHDGFLDKIRSIESPIQPGDTLATAKSRVQPDLIDALGYLSDSISSDMKDAHIDHPGSFYGAALHALEPTFRRIRDEQCQLGCTSSCASLLFTPSILRFDRQPAGETGPVLFATLSNDGSTDVEVSSISAATGVFTRTADGTCGTSFPFTLTAGQFCSIGYTFTPQDASVQTQTITAASPTAASATLNLEGKGIALRIFPTFAHFETRINATSAPKTIQVMNTANSAINITSIDPAPAKFLRTGGSCGAGSFSLAAGSVCTLEYAFAPTSAGDHDRAVFITSDVDGARRLQLFGVGVARGNLVVAPAVHAFGSQTIGGTSAAATITLTNDGSATMNVTSIGVVPAPFTHTGGTCGAVPFALAQNASCTIDIAFAPTAAGPAAMTLTVAGDADGGGSVALTGTGAP